MAPIHTAYGNESFKDDILLKSIPGGKGAVIVFGSDMMRILPPFFFLEKIRGSSDHLSFNSSSICATITSGHISCSFKQNQCRTQHKKNLIAKAYNQFPAKLKHKNRFHLRNVDIRGPSHLFLPTSLTRSLPSMPTCWIFCRGVSFSAYLRTDSKPQETDFEAGTTTPNTSLQSWNHFGSWKSGEARLRSGDKYR